MNSLKTLLPLMPTALRMRLAGSAAATALTLVFVTSLALTSLALTSLALTSCAGGGAIEKIDYPNLPTIEQQGGVVGTFTTKDGMSIRYASFKASTNSATSAATSATATAPVPSVGTVVLTTGRTQFIEAYLEAIAEWQKRGYDVWAMDWRGQGLSSRIIADAPSKGHVGSFEDYLQDLDYLVTNLAKPAQGAPNVIMGQSMGGGLVIRYAAEHPGVFQKVVAGAPMLDFAAPSFLKGVISFAASVNPQGYVMGEGGDYSQANRTFDGNVITHDNNRFKRFHAFIDREPRLALGAATNQWANEGVKSCNNFTNTSYMAKLAAPVLLFSAETDKLVSADAQKKLAEQYPSLVRRVELPGTYHEVFLETDATQQKIWQEIDAFLKK
jgi:lysophospholipase